MLREIEVNHLSVGMYVAELDRPWLETPFPLQGFYVRSADDIRRIAEFCNVVRIDPRRHDRKLSFDDRHHAANGDAAAAGRAYEETATVEEELPAARQALEQNAATFRGFWEQLSARRRVSISNLRIALDPLVESILRNKDALVTLMRVQHLDRNTHEHCIALAVWGSLLGRQLGLPPDEIRLLALGCSLLDVGKVRLPKQMLYKPGPLTASEYAVAQAHVDYSLQMLMDSGDAEDAVVATVRWHHERMDGSGYPNGLKGSAIPMFARIAGIVDTYDAMISPRSYAPTCSSYEALIELQDHCPRHFQPQLVDQFVQAIGLFPNGALVELSTGEVGVVCGQNPGRRLRPKVMLILDAEKRQRDKLTIIDLKLQDEHDVRVARELARNEYGIDAREFFL